MTIRYHNNKRLKYIFIYFTILTNYETIAANNNKENQKSLKIIGQTFDVNVFQEFIKKNKNVKIMILEKCSIEMDLKDDNYTFILLPSSSISEKYKKNSGFIHIKKNEINFYRQSLNMDHSEVFTILEKEVTPNSIQKINLYSIKFTNSENIKKFFMELTKLHNKIKFFILALHNPSIENEEDKENAIGEITKFITKTKVNLEENTTSSSGTNAIYAVDPVAEMAGGYNKKSNNKFPFSKKYLESELEKRSHIIDKALEKTVLEGYDYVQKHGDETDQQTKALVKFYIDRTDLLMKFPQKNTAMRKFKDTVFLKKLLKILFYREFPAGADKSYQLIEDNIVGIVKTGTMDNISNTMLVGAAGIGKTSLAKIITMLFALIVSDSKEISHQLLEEVVNGNEDSLDLLYKILETKSSEHLVLIKGSTLVDINVLVGVSRSYTSPSAGLIAKSLAGKKSPLLVFVDEGDKMNNYHNSSGGKNNAIQVALLNFFDGKGGEDSWLEGTIFLNRFAWVIMTANNVDNVSEVLKDRFSIVNIEGPTAEGKELIIILRLIRFLKDQNFINSVQNYTIEANGHEKTYKIGGTKKDRILLVLSDKVLKSIVKHTQSNEGVRASLRHIDSLGKKLHLQILEDMEKNISKLHYFINFENMNTYIDIEGLVDEALHGTNMLCVYEGTDGNHKLGSVYILPSKNRSAESIMIIGGGRGNGNNYHIFRDLGFMVAGVLSNLSTIVDSTVVGKFGLTMIKMESTNNILVIPTDGVEESYTKNLLASIVVSMISSLRKIPMKKKVIILGELTPAGQLLMGNIKYKSIVSVITNRREDCNILILPASLRNNRSLQQYFAQLPPTVKIIYCGNLSDILEAVLETNYI